MAAKLKNLDEPGAVEEFVDEVANLVRSQVAAVIGNVGMVVPCVIALSAAIQLASGAPMISREEADYVFHSLHLLNPLTLLFAAFTGVLLFVSSLIAAGPRTGSCCTGWIRRCATTRASRRCWARSARRAGPAFMRKNISGFASNISLGMMLGLVPPVLAFFGLGPGGAPRHLVQRPAAAARRGLRTRGAAHAGPVVVRGRRFP
jgi:site-specific recombinase